MAFNERFNYEHIKSFFFFRVTNFANYLGIICLNFGTETFLVHDTFL